MLKAHSGNPTETWHASARTRFVIGATAQRRQQIIKAVSLPSLSSFSSSSAICQRLDPINFPLTRRPPARPLRLLFIFPQLRFHASRISGVVRSLVMSSAYVELAPRTTCIPDGEKSHGTIYEVCVAWEETRLWYRGSNRVGCGKNFL